MFSLAQAAKAAGKSKPTIPRAIKAGRLSATRGENGSYDIDPSELARVFPLTGDMPGTMKQSVSPNGAGTSPAITPGEMRGYGCCWPNERRRFGICAPGSTARLRSAGT
jgi:hypothetical protein